MAKHVLRNAYVGINGVDLSDHASSVTTESTAEEIDMTSFTASGYREFAQGFKDATFTVTFFQDYASRVASTRRCIRCTTRAARSPSISRRTRPRRRA